MVNLVLIGFGVLAMAIGVVLYVVQFRQGLRATASARWPTASGTIITSVLQQATEGKRRYRAAVQYSYRVAGRDYQADRIFWGGNTGRERHMASVVNTYPAGSAVRVRYDPHNPAEAVLDPEQNIGSRQTVLYAIAMITLGLFAFTGGAYSLFH